MRDYFKGVDRLGMHLHFMDDVGNVGVPNADLVVEASGE